MVPSDEAEIIITPNWYSDVKGVVISVCGEGAGKTPAVVGVVGERRSAFSGTVWQGAGKQHVEQEQVWTRLRCHPEAYPERIEVGVPAVLTSMYNVLRQRPRAWQPFHMT